MSKRDFRPLPPGEASYPTSDEFAPQRRSVLRQLGAGLGLLLLGGSALAGEPTKKKKPPKKDEKKKPKPPEHVNGGKSGPSSELDEDLAEDLAAGDDKGKKKPKGKGKKGDDAPKKPHPPLRGEPSHPEAALDGEGRGPWETEPAGDSKDSKDSKKKKKKPDDKKKEPPRPPPGEPPAPHSALDERAQHPELV